jgi:glycerol-3-phosphate acyltransferase PlsY
MRATRALASGASAEGITAMVDWGAALLAYMLGSVSFAVLVSRVFGLADPRSYGSGNPGATNVLRSGHRAAAILTLLLDGAKGWLAVWLARFLAIDDTGVAICAVAVFLGHLYPVFFQFRGGKGVATAFGVWFALYWWLGLFAALTWLTLAAFFRYSSLAALAAAAFAPFFYVLLVGVDVTAAALVVIAALIFYRHRKNIVNLFKGSESKLGRKAPPADATATGSPGPSGDAR